jgi:hypothetical protein
VVFLALFVKWTLQTNKKNVFEEPSVSALTKDNFLFNFSTIYKVQGPNKKILNSNQ